MTAHRRRMEMAKSAVNRLEMGQTVASIARDYGVSRETVYRAVKVYCGVSAKDIQADHKADRLAVWKHLYQLGTTVKGIAEDAGVSHQCVSKVLREGGVEMRPRGNQKGWMGS